VTRPKLQLFVASFLMLFVELAMIRGTTAAVVYLSFFTNLVLLASFLGIGLGFLRARGERDALRWAPLLLAALLTFLMVFPVRIGPAVDRVPQLFGLGHARALPEWISLPLIFIGVVTVMAAIAERVGRLFSRFQPLDAYRLDVLGSIGGIAVFSALSFADAGPFVWVVIAGIALIILLREELTRQLAASLLLLLALGAVTLLQPRDVWSPYQHVTYAPRDEGRIAIRVNNRPHQTMASLTVLLAAQPFYAYPYTHVPAGPGNVLIVGAGSGNDVALALDEGATHVDAVEIDPVLQRLGRDLHPEHPYQDPRVSVHIDDGRAFLERTRTSYDLILFALPDSLTLIAGQGGLRLESYLFTTEAMRTVRDHLAPDGTFSMYNYYRSDVFERYAATLTQVFGHEPCIDRGSLGATTRSQSVLTIGLREDTITCDTPWVERGVAPEPATDDHPFPYLRGRSIPANYVVAIALVLLASLVAVRVGSGRPIREMRPYIDLFCMGGAFLLLETKNVVQFALLFGTTWLVNSLVRGDPIGGPRGGGGRPALPVARSARAVPAPRREPDPRVGDHAGVAPAPGSDPPLRRRRRRRLCAGVPGEPDLLPTIPRRRNLDGGLRGELARRHARRRAGVRGDRRWVPEPADLRGRALRSGVPHWAPASARAIRRRARRSSSSAAGIPPSKMTHASPPAITPWDTSASW
jgi:protein-L-isoaspartate O-methyltransferase